MQLLKPLILGSQSPRRADLLRALDLPFSVVIRPTEEEVISTHTPIEAVMHIARQKAEAFKDLIDSHLVLTADTIVVIDNQIIGKPQHEENAVNMLQSLSGRMHEVHTAVCLCHGVQFESFVESTKVYFRALSPSEIAHYIRTYKPFDKAGSYGVQEWLGMTAITHIEGDFYNVMGLPTSQLYRKMKDMGWLLEG